MKKWLAKILYNISIKLNPSLNYKLQDELKIEDKFIRINPSIYIDIDTDNFYNQDDMERIEMSILYSLKPYLVRKFIGAVDPYKRFIDVKNIKKGYHVSLELYIKR